MASFTIINTGNKYELQRGYSLLNNLLLNDIITPAKCGGKAICGRCRVRIINGNNYCTKPNPEEKARLNPEQLALGWRLACQTQCIKDIQIYLPDSSEVSSETN